MLRCPEVYPLLFCPPSLFPSAQWEKKIRPTGTQSVSRIARLLKGGGGGEGGGGVEILDTT